MECYATQITVGVTFGFYFPLSPMRLRQYIFSCLEYRTVYKPEAAGRGNVIRVGFLKQENIAAISIVPEIVLFSSSESAMREFKLFIVHEIVLFSSCESAMRDSNLLFAGKLFSKKYFVAFKRGRNTVSGRQNE